MIKTSLVGLISALSVQGSVTSGIRKSHYHEPVLHSSPGSTTWLTFPTAKTQHHELVQQAAQLSGIDRQNLHLGTVAAATAADPDAQSFFHEHRNSLDLHPSCVMELVSERRNPSSNLVHRTYKQVIAGVRVFGGDFKMTLSAASQNLEVLNTHGASLTEAALNANFNELDVAGALGTAPSLEDIRFTLLLHLSSTVRGKLYVNDIELPSSRPVELVWYPHGSDEVALAYHVRGVVRIDEFISFYAFVEVGTGRVLSLVQLNDDEHLRDTPASSPASTSQALSQGVKRPRVLSESGGAVSISSVPSPFFSPISGVEIYCYDQYLKDFNDDQDDNYYSPDPDRFSAETLVFDTTSGTHVYPTADAEMNLLIDNTLYSKYLYYSLSGGEYKTWRKDEGPFNIEYNLSMANAYFDGEWGIHFGTGFITDDVVAHEWSHGYTQTGADLIYKGQTGSMNEGFSDIFGESIDILNKDSADTTVPRAASPASCTSTMNSRTGYGPPPGTDSGNRWSIGEEVSYYHWSNGDGSFRDMYKPECFFHPGATYSPYYACTTYYDHGGVHLNSGVFNHLFAVLVDGGEFVNGASVTTIAPLGLVKTLNLYWRTHEEMTSAAVFYDFAMTINEVCSLNIGETLYYPNVFNSTISEAGSLSAADCLLVSAAVTASGMDSTAEVCPNLDCSWDECMWAMCPAAESGNYEVFYEDYYYYMGEPAATGSSGLIKQPCGATAPSSYVRVFDQNQFHLEEFTLSCIQFGYIMLGQTTITMDIYIDQNGGDPDLASLQLQRSQQVTTINANYHMQVQTVTLDTPLRLMFNKSYQTLVVVMTAPVMVDGYISGGGLVNEDVDVYGRPTGQTFVGGGCMSELQSSNSSTQWYVRLQGTSTYKSRTGTSPNYDKTEVIMVIVACCVTLITVIAFSYYVMTKNFKKLAVSQKMADMEESHL